MENAIVGPIGAALVLGAGGIMAIGAWMFERQMHRADEADDA